MLRDGATNVMPGQRARWTTRLALGVLLVAGSAAFVPLLLPGTTDQDDGSGSSAAQLVFIACYGYLLLAAWLRPLARPRDSSRSRHLSDHRTGVRIHPLEPVALGLPSSRRRAGADGGSRFVPPTDHELSRVPRRCPGDLLGHRRQRPGVRPGLLGCRCRPGHTISAAWGLYDEERAGSVRDLLRRHVPGLSAAVGPAKAQDGAGSASGLPC